MLIYTNNLKVLSRSWPRKVVKKHPVKKRGAFLYSELTIPWNNYFASVVAGACSAVSAVSALPSAGTCFFNSCKRAALPESLVK